MKKPYRTASNRPKHYFNQCPRCSARLDPGERCDCDKNAPTDQEKQRDK